MEAKQTPLIDLRAALAQQAEPTVTEDMKSAVRWAPSSAYWSERLREFFGPDAREGIDALERRLAKAQQAEQDLSRCPQCNGPADNGFDRSIPPSPYLCTKCMAEPVEPVAWLAPDGSVRETPAAKSFGEWVWGPDDFRPLYTAPPQRPTEPVQGPEGMVEFLADLQRSRTKYPKNRRMFDGLMGEIDELRRAYAGDGDIRAEAFDVAVCAFRIATEGDAGGNARLEQAESDHETRAELAEQQVVQLAEERDHYRNLWQKAQQAEPAACSNTFGCRCPKHFALEPAQQAEPVEPVAWVASKDGRVIYDDVSADDGLLRVSGDFENDEQRIRYAHRIVDKLNAALAQRTMVQEPVGEVLHDWSTEKECIAGTWAHLNDLGKNLPVGTKLYTAPPQRKLVPLTEEEIKTAFHAARNAKLGASQDNSRHRLSVIEIARAVERAVWEKNHG